MKFQQKKKTQDFNRRKCYNKKFGSFDLFKDIWQVIGSNIIHVGRVESCALETFISFTRR